MSQPVSQTPAPAESRSNGATVPISLIILTALLIYAGAVYFDDHGGWFSPKVYGPYKSIAELEPYQPKLGNPIFEQGKAIYGKTCVACHQASGQGTPGQFPPLAGSDWVNEAQPGRMIRIVLNGAGGPITVHGQNFNNNMVPWNSLSDEDIAAVISYVRQNREWGNNASEVTPAQVKAVRDKIKNHPGPWSPDAELLKINPAD
jgi:mono/diheme cytochrome c family protein